MKALWLLAAVVGIGCLAACGRRPTFVTKHGVAFFDDTSTASKALAEKVEDQLLIDLASFGYDVKYMAEQCFPGTSVTVVKELSAEQRGRCHLSSPSGCLGYDDGAFGEEIVLVANSRGCLHVYAHELVHRVQYCYRMPYSNHSDYGIWEAVGGFLARYPQWACAVQ